MAELKNIVLNTSTEELEKILSPFIEEQFPNFIRTDYRKVVLFVKAYYEWMDQQNNPGFVTSHLDSMYDVDKNLETFYSHFKNLYLNSFPELLATNSSGNKPNKKTLLKKIRDFYGNKGTENSYKFLFKVLYDSDLELYYPKVDILKASDGQWTEPISIKTTSVNGSNLFGVKNGTIVQYDSGRNVLASAEIDSVVQYSFNGLLITEFFIKDLNGDFVPNRDVTVSKGSVEYSEIAYSVLGEFFVELPGEGYQIGDTVSVVTTAGTGFVARVEQTGLAGSIKKIGIINSGVNYGSDVITSVISNSGGRTAKVIALRSAITRYPGYFSGNRGKVSSNKYVQDGNYYQEFSYELKSAVSLETYFDVLKRIVHPSGMKMFGSILVKKAIDNALTSSSQETTFETPVIGRYTPYAPRTFNDLRNGYFLPNQVKGATLQVWLSGYNVRGNTSTGVTANRSDLGETADLAFGVNSWQSLVTGYTFQHAAVSSDVWLTPRFKYEAVNTHPSLVVRPVNEIGSDLYFSTTELITDATAAQWRSFGYEGPTLGRLGLTAGRSYFVVCKPRAGGSITAVGATNGRAVISDHFGHHGIAFGYTGDTTTLKVLGWNVGASRTNWVIGNAGSTGEWKLLSQTYSYSTSGNSGPLSLFLNGVCLGTTAQATNITSASHGATLGVGESKNVVDLCFDGEIAEILCYQGDVGEADRQKVEGYLAHKYNLDGNLPAAHPYKTTPPGASLPAGGWSGPTGDFYPKGYNPYIGSTAQTGPDGSTAAAGSLFYGTNLGYTYTIVDEFGLTAHNPIGSPLGSTHAWYSGNEGSLTPEGMRGLVLWLKPENIGVCGSVVNGVSTDVWTDASPSANHALPPTWDRWNGAFTTTNTSITTGGGWSKHLYDSTNPVTKIRFVLNGLCGGFTTGRLMAVGFDRDPAASTSYSGIDYGFYSYGPHDNTPTNLNKSRRVLWLTNFSGTLNNADLLNAGPLNSTNFAAYDNYVFELEYEEPNIVWRINDSVVRKQFCGYGQTFYFDSSFYTLAYTGHIGHSFTVLGMWNGINPVTPTVSTLVTNKPAEIYTQVYAGVTVDKLRPTLQTAGFGGATGVSFNGGLLFAPQTLYGGVSLAAGICMGFTAAGSSAEKLLTGQHLYLKRPLKVTDDADIFVVYRPTLEGISYGYGVLASRNTNVMYGNNLRFDSVIFNRSYNEPDRNTSLQTSSYYSILPNGTVMYAGASLPPVGLMGFRPQGDAAGAAQNFIAYDPHVSGVCMGICVGEATRDTSGRIESFLNGDRALNRSRSTGRQIGSVSAPPTEDFALSKNLVYRFDAGKTASLGEFVTAKTANLLDAYPFTETPINFIGPLAPEMWSRSTAAGTVLPDSVVLVTQDGGAALGTDEVYEFTTGTSADIFLSLAANPSAWVDSTTTSTTWTAAFTIRRDDGGVISAANVYIYTSDSNDYAAGTVENLGGGWYRVTRTKTGTASTARLVGLVGLAAGVKYRIGRAMLQPYPASSDIAGTTIRSSTSYPVGYTRVGTVTANEVSYKTGPSGRQETVWHGKNHSTNRTSSGFNNNIGFITPTVSIDRTKLYRYSVWVNRAVMFSREVYFGNNTTVLKRSDGSVDTNPYFTRNDPSSSAYVGKQNQWILVVGHIYPEGSGTGSNHPNSGFYLPNSGTTYAGLDASFGDKIWSSTSTSGSLRVFLYGADTLGEDVRFARPRIEVVDGSEISIEDLTSGNINTVYDLSTTGAVSEVLNEVGYSSDGGGCVVFKGGPGVISTSTSLSFGSNRNITWEAWVKPSSTNPTNEMFMGAGGLPYFSNWGGNSRILWSVNLSGTQALIYTEPGQFVTGAWHHVVCVSEYDGTNTRYTIYKNGVRVPTTGVLNNQSFGDSSVIGFVGRERLTDDSSVAADNGNVVFSVGNRTRSYRFDPDGRDYAFQGSVSNTRVYSRALTEAEVRQNFNALRGRFGL
jgi:hypothetical protein